MPTKIRRQGGYEEGENSPYVWKHRSSTFLGLLPCSPFNFKHNLLRQGMGTAGHLTLLRLLSFPSGAHLYTCSFIFHVSIFVSSILFLLSLCLFLSSFTLSQVVIVYIILLFSLLLTQTLIFFPVFEWLCDFSRGLSRGLCLSFNSPVRLSVCRSITLKFESEKTRN